ncbi:DUF5133 domain-containing protein [Streptomyces aureus]|uniref:DUF5133 domain-containing protein n=1 Tax=Streptomyces aureus TaxID=193461 RepID=A0ABV4SZA2_9ACTN
MRKHFEDAACTLCVLLGQRCGREAAARPRPICVPMGRSTTPHHRLGDGGAPPRTTPPELRATRRQRGSGG